MLPLFLTVHLLFSCLNSLTEANSTHLPRMTFTEKETPMIKLSLPGHSAPVGIVLEREPGIVIAAGQKHLYSFNFQNPQESPREISVLWAHCIDKGPPQRVKADCNYNITLVHKKSKDNEVFLCGTNDRETVCCDMNLAVEPPSCITLPETEDIKTSINEFVIKEGEPSVLVDSDLYITYSGSREFVGIHKFGENRLTPASSDKEQHYVGLVLNKRRDNPLQSKVYAFYKEKNRETGLGSEMWLPFVTQVCMKDRGGRKNNLQFSWTSQMNARLYCGDPESRQHFSELVDVATVHAHLWQDTRIYALFRNEWGMSAVCVYTIQDIENIFMTSPFKGNDHQRERSRKCVKDSTNIAPPILTMIRENSEMENPVWPMKNSGPLLFHHHSYTHIYVDGSQNKENNDHTVLFLSLNNGGIHKAIQSESQTFVIAEYRPFDHRTHILGMILQPSSRKLYVNSQNELVQVDVANCTHYGNSCQQCVLARDPYCGWNELGRDCSPQTKGTKQDVTHGNHSICPKVQLSGTGKAFRYSTDPQAGVAKDSIILPPESKYFLQCLVTSHHAQYTWHHLKGNTSCDSREKQCLLLIDSMGPEQEGTYTCVSEEMGYSRVLAQYRLQVESRAVGRSSSPLLWLCLITVLIKSLSC
ncbi:semaphorin-7A isoform X1 [Epinephelus fuscoguttatus]|uniref:semaphorin-7A isoform X1 n=1 Tax=Epinephelus fuscoguttatus TaxID=293821 RepID=UPI0020D13763|nr:semaphorin-7A isoform X1 [Epinephelus fuscoguttatus]